MFRSLNAFWQRFRRNQGGNFSTLFSLSAPVIMVAGGMAVDFFHGVSQEAKMRAALDSAAPEGVKVASSSSQAAGITAAQNMVYANLQTPNISVVALTAIFDTVNWNLTPNTA